MQEEIQQLKDELAQFKAMYFRDRTESSVGFRNKVALIDADLELSTGTGTKIGTSPLQKLAFYGSIPIVQQASIPDPSGGATQDTQARTAINSILDVLDTYGLTA